MQRGTKAEDPGADDYDGGRRADLRGRHVRAQIYGRIKETVDDLGPSV